MLDGVPHEVDTGPHHKHNHQQVLQEGGTTDKVGVCVCLSVLWYLKYCGWRARAAMEQLQQDEGSDDVVSHVAVVSCTACQVQERDMMWNGHSSVLCSPPPSELTNAGQGEGEVLRHVQGVDGSAEVKQPALHGQNQPQVYVKPTGTRGTLQVERRCLSHTAHAESRLALYYDTVTAVSHACWTAHYWPVTFSTGPASRDVFCCSPPSPSPTCRSCRLLTVVTSMIHD